MKRFFLSLCLVLAATVVSAAELPKHFSVHPDERIRYVPEYKTGQYWVKLSVEGGGVGLVDFIPWFQQLEPTLKYSTGQMMADFAAQNGITVRAWSDLHLMAGKDYYFQLPRPLIAELLPVLKDNGGGTYALTELRSQLPTGDVAQAPVELSEDEKQAFVGRMQSFATTLAAVEDELDFWQVLPLSARERLMADLRSELFADEAFVADVGAIVQTHLSDYATTAELAAIEARFAGLEERVNALESAVAMKAEQAEVTVLTARVAELERKLELLQTGSVQMAAAVESSATATLQESVEDLTRVIAALSKRLPE